MTSASLYWSDWLDSTSTSTTTVTSSFKAGSPLFYVVTVAGSCIVILSIMIIILCAATYFLTTDKGKSCLQAATVKSTRQPMRSRESEREDNVQTEMQGINSYIVLLRLYR